MQFHLFYTSLLMAQAKAYVTVNERVYSGSGTVQRWIKLARLREAHCGAWGGMGLTEEGLKKPLGGERVLCFD